MTISDFLAGLLNAELHTGFGSILWREIIGNVFGLASAWLGMRRRVWAWPIGILGNVLLFTVFAGVIFGNPQDLTLWGQAGRQLFFIAVSAYGFVQWLRYRRAHGGKEGVAPRWASGRERAVLIGAYLVLWLVLYFGLAAVGSWSPVLDAYILAGSIMATYGMARGYVEFWLIWILVDLVGVPTLLMAHFYPSALMYGFYGAFCLIGFVQWWRTSSRLKLAADRDGDRADDSQRQEVEPVG